MIILFLVVSQQHLPGMGVLLLQIREEKKLIHVFLPSSILEAILIGLIHVLFFNHYLIIHQFIDLPRFFSTSSPECDLASPFWCATSTSNSDFSPDMFLPQLTLSIGRCHHPPSWPNQISVSCKCPLNFSSLSSLTTHCHLFGKDSWSGMFWPSW